MTPSLIEIAVRQQPFTAILSPIITPLEMVGAWITKRADPAERCNSPQIPISSTSPVNIGTTIHRRAAEHQPESELGKAG